MLDDYVDRVAESYNQQTVEIWQVLKLRVNSPVKFLSYFVLPPITVNITLSPSLLANGQ